MGGEIGWRDFGCRERIIKVRDVQEGFGVCGQEIMRIFYELQGFCVGVMLICEFSSIFRREVLWWEYGRYNISVKVGGLGLSFGVDFISFMFF